MSVDIERYCWLFVVVSPNCCEPSQSSCIQISNPVNYNSQVKDLSPSSKQQQQDVVNNAPEAMDLVSKIS